MQPPKFTVLTWISLLLDVAGFAAIFWLFDKYAPIGVPNLTLMWLAITSILFITCVVIFLPKHLKNYKPTINSIFLSYSVVLFSYAGFLYLNCAFDESSIVRQRLPIREKHPSQFKGETYVVTFFLPRSEDIAANGFEGAEVSRPAYERADPTDTYINLELRAGLFGIPWIESHWLEYPPEKRR